MECPFNMEPSLKCVEERCCFECRYEEVHGRPVPLQAVQGHLRQKPTMTAKGRCMYTKE